MRLATILLLLLSAVATAEPTEVNPPIEDGGINHAEPVGDPKTPNCVVIWIDRFTEDDNPETHPESVYAIVQFRTYDLSTKLEVWMNDSDLPDTWVRIYSDPALPQSATIQNGVASTWGYAMYSSGKTWHNGARKFRFELTNTSNGRQFVRTSIVQAPPMP